MKKAFLKVDISPDAIDPDDAELLADMITAAVNDALTQCKEEIAREMGKLTGGVGGGYLEFSDQVTLTRALEGRRPI